MSQLPLFGSAEPDSWWDFAISTALDFASQRSFTTEDIRQVCGDPPRPPQMGAVFLVLRQKELIRPIAVERSPRAVRHGGIYRRWEGVPRLLGGAS